MLHGRPVAILGGVRIPFCRQNTAYAELASHVTHKGVDAQRYLLIAVGVWAAACAAAARPRRP